MIPRNTLTSGGGSGGTTSDDDDVVNLADAYEEETGEEPEPDNPPDDDGASREFGTIEDDGSIDRDDDGGDGYDGGGGYTTITNDGTESTVNDTGSTDAGTVDNSGESDSEPADNSGTWGNDADTAPDNTSEGPTQEDLEQALAEQRAAFNEQMNGLLDSLPDQLGGSEDGGGLSPAMAGSGLAVVAAVYLLGGGE